MRRLFGIPLEPVRYDDLDFIRRLGFRNLNHSNLGIVLLPTQSERHLPCDVTRVACERATRLTSPKPQALILFSVRAPCVEHDRSTASARVTSQRLALLLLFGARENWSEKKIYTWSVFLNRGSKTPRKAM